MTGEITTKQSGGAPSAPEITGYPLPNIVVLAGIGGTNVYVQTRESEWALGTYTRFI